MENDTENNLWKQILEMSDEEALHVLQNFIGHVITPRKNGKTMTVMKWQIAWLKAMAALQEKVNNPEKVAYVCKYGKPGDLCRHTTNIRDAKHFIQVDDLKWMEQLWEEDNGEN